MLSWNIKVMINVTNRQTREEDRVIFEQAREGGIVRSIQAKDSTL